jgi:hypothetical protein
MKLFISLVMMCLIVPVAHAVNEEAVPASNRDYAK